MRKAFGVVLIACGIGAVPVWLAVGTPRDQVATGQPAYFFAAVGSGSV